MEAALEAARAKDTKERLAGVERLHEALDAAARRGLSAAEVASLVDTCMDLARDGNFRVAQGGLQALSAAAVLAGDHFKIHLNALVPSAVERLGDSKQPVREAARQLLVTLMEEMYKNMGSQFHEELRRHNLPAYMLKEINSRLDKIEPNAPSSNGARMQCRAKESRSISANPKRGSPRKKNTPRESTLFGGKFYLPGFQFYYFGDMDINEKPVEPIRFHSEKELVRDFEKVASALNPEKDWSIRIAAMQRIEALVYGGAIDYPSFLMLLKQLVPPLSSQLSDRRSSIVKQACHLLNVLSKELLGDFEPCAEIFIPVLFKLVVITVLVIAESADNSIKSILRNCKVSRVLPLIADTAKNDRGAVLRARCCEYALLILEYWADAPEIHRSADLYEDLIKSCVADSMSEVLRSVQRQGVAIGYSLKHGPSIINDEDGGKHKRDPSPSLHERGVQLSRASSHAGGTHFGYGTSAIVAMDKGAAISSESSLSSSSILLSQSKTIGRSAERSIESVLSSSKQKVSAIENLLKGVSMSDRHNFSAIRSTSLNHGVDHPSSRDPPTPSAPTASYSSLNGVTSSRNDGSSKERSSSPYLRNLSSEPISSLSLPSLRRSTGRSQDGSIMDENHDTWPTRQSPKMQMDKHYVDMPYRDVGYRNSLNSHVPHFQRPLRKQVVSSASASGRRSFDYGHVTSNDMCGYMDGPTSLNDALSEGLSPSSDWAARVAAFNFIQILLQHGQKGIQDITQNFEKVMKLFFRYLDDPHHKVAQAAFSTLADIIPAFKKHFESYVERILPYIFSRLVDPKELVRQPCFSTLEIVGRTYSIDTLLPALVRSLDEQRSPKAKLAVLEFANKSFDSYTVDSEGYSNCGFLKLWLTKLAPLIHEKNAKLKEASVSGIISVYSHFDSDAVLNFILSLSIDEQNIVRRALKQYTPRIEVDLVTYFQNKKERQRPKSYDQVDSSTSEDGYALTLKKSFPFGRFSDSLLDIESRKKMNTVQESALLNVPIGRTASDAFIDDAKQCFERASEAEVLMQSRELQNNTCTVVEAVHSWADYPEKSDATMDDGHCTGTTRLDLGHLPSDGRNSALVISGEHTQEGDPFVDLSSVNITPHASNGPSIPKLLHQVPLHYALFLFLFLLTLQALLHMFFFCAQCITIILFSNFGKIGYGGQVSSLDKREALQQLVRASTNKDNFIWTKILTTVLEVLDDADSSVREISLLLVTEMLHNQKDSMEESIEIVLEKLLHVTKDDVAKVSNEAHQCLYVVLAKYDPFRCLAIIVPLLVSDDEKTLVMCINCLTKLVGRLSQEEVITQLPSFLPALFDAFSNQSPDVRKAVVFCLVDIYIILGKAFVPYLEGLSSTQLRLVTIYANRILQARSGAPLDANQ
ncbi:CLIP-associated protein [Dichanthelium oligosanthes]|uniref:CLIP-associated protein n=1 Tax=Dichanthelium oligosanthes TaxID=888268 RepID=A0A1E5VR21_9POAL|nr:CLIP-associated protein [Dichanthelium oligosanthes]